MIRKILLVGCGNIGSRHLEGILKSNLQLEIIVIEKSKEKIESAKNIITRFKTTNKNVTFLRKFPNKKNLFDLLICATTSEKRYELLKSLVKNVKFNKVILEKLAFQNSNDFKKAINLLKKNKITCWVNCPRREQKIYQEIKNKLKKVESLNIQVTGNRWNMASNSIHFFDLFYYLKKHNYNFSKNTGFLKKKASKHLNFIELTGLLKIHSQQNTIILDDQKISKNIIIKIQSRNLEYIINETRGFAKIKSNKGMHKKNIKILKQSDLTTILIKKIFSKKNIYLPTLKEAYSSHKLVFSSFKKYFVSNGKVLNCPIT